MTTRIEYHSATDERGTCQFSLFWQGVNPVTGAEIERGQVFRADPREYGHPRPEDSVPARSGKGEA
jgi:hypothetical protein